MIVYYIISYHIILYDRVAAGRGLSPRVRVDSAPILSIAGPAIPRAPSRHAHEHRYTWRRPHRCLACSPMDSHGSTVACWKVMAPKIGGSRPASDTITRLRSHRRHDFIQRDSVHIHWEHRGPVKTQHRAATGANAKVAAQSNPCFCENPGTLWRPLVSQEG